MAAEGDFITYIFTCEEGEVIPQDATRFIAHESVTVIPAQLFYHHPNIVELICHAGVVRIELWAFWGCPRLRRVIIPGVKDIEWGAFRYCIALAYVECPKLEKIGDWAFGNCKSLSNIDLPSAKVVEGWAFGSCKALVDVKFGKNLESIGKWAFFYCPSLERIAIPLKNDLITGDNTFKGCRNLKSIDLLDGEALREYVAFLLLGEWRNDMNEEINSINQLLSMAGDGNDEGGKARAIREWIERALRKIAHYKAEHRRLLNVATTSLVHALPNDIVMNNVLPFLELPSRTLDWEAHEEEDDTEESYDTSDGGGSEDEIGGNDDENNSGDELHKTSFRFGIFCCCRLFSS